MSLSLLQAFLDWLGQHSVWSGLIIFTIACSESLALVGLLVPGVVLMFAIGTLIATGHLAFWPAVIWATLGAIAGDGISYWLGHYYQDRLTKLWPLSHHPELLEKGIIFFQRHGGKSVLFGRFIGPVRPIVPAVAGMYGMPLRRFFLINILSAIAWAPLNLLPGMAFGLSLAVAGEVAGRLVAAILLLVVSLLMLLWLGRRLYNSLLPRVDRMLFYLANWSRHHPVAGHIPAALISPAHPEVRILSLLALMLFFTSSLFIAFIGLAGPAEFLSQIDKLLHANLGLLHNPWFNHLMLAISSWTNTAGILILTLITAAWLIWQRNLLALWHLLATLCLPWLLSYSLPLLFDPLAVSLPSGPIMLMTAVYGFIAVVLVREIAPRYHLPVYLLVLVLIFLGGFALVYLQINVFSAALGGLMLGSIWLAILGIAYRRHVHQAYVQRPALAMLSVVFVVCLLAVMPAISHQQVRQQTEPLTRMDFNTWQGQGWRQLPVVRNDIRYQRNHPLNLQWVGELQTIRQQLHRLGWQIPVSARSLQFLQWFNPKPDDRALPLLPQVHDGHYDVLRMLHFDGTTLRFIRLWQTNIVVSQAGGQQPLWVGSTGKVYREEVLGLTMLRTSADYHSMSQQLMTELLQTYPQLPLRIEPVTIGERNIQVLLLHSR